MMGYHSVHDLAQMGGDLVKVCPLDIGFLHQWGQHVGAVPLRCIFDASIKSSQHERNVSYGD